MNDNMTNLSASVVMLALLTGAVSATDKTEFNSRKPNVILIYADDLGGGLLGCYGQQIIKTPNIDNLAENGMRFRNAYGCIYCAPARASLLTGLHSGRKNAWSITKGGLVVLQDRGKITPDKADAILSKAIQARPGEVFLAEIPKDEGYITAEIGKLEWGFTTTDERLNDVQKEYASMVKMLDDHVGMIVMKLKELGIYNNTIIIFTSDNGHELYYVGNKRVSRNRSYHGEADVFKGAIDDDAGSKWTDWQGGIRVPLIITWPGKIKPGVITDYMCAAYDLMPTIADITGSEMPAGKDGISFLPVLLGKHRNQHKYIIVDNAVLKDGWKLVKFKNSFLLFNLKKDPGERKNVAAGFPEKLKVMKDIYNQEVGARRSDL